MSPTFKSKANNFVIKAYNFTIYIRLVIYNPYFRGFTKKKKRERDNLSKLRVDHQVKSDVKHI